jgi:ubiquinone/menaquinone biosynthesis C-methylase UbiE
MIVDAFSDELNAVLADDRSVRLIEEDIYSVLPDVSVAHHYDKRATIYDAVVSTRLYNLVMWGTSSSHYVEFARQALNSSSEGIFLDAGCGSMLFTARTYADSKRRIVAFDQSLAMLRRARGRLKRLSGCVPEHIRLLQADLNDLPFRQKSFRTIMCLNVLHQIDDAAGLIAGLNKLLSQGGYLYLTSLVSTNRAIGDWYLKALYRTGEFVRPRNELELRELFKAFDRKMSYAEKGNMAFVTMAKLNTA